MFITVEQSTGELQLHIVLNMKAFWDFANNYSDITDHELLKWGRIKDVQQFVTAIEELIVGPVERGEFMVNQCISCTCIFCVCVCML